MGAWQEDGQGESNMIPSEVYNGPAFLHQISLSFPISLVITLLLLSLSIHRYLFELCADQEYHIHEALYSTDSFSYD